MRLKLRNPLGQSRKLKWLRSSIPLSFALLSCACSVNAGKKGSSDVARLPITGTIFTIVFENHSQDDLLNHDTAYLKELASRYGTADAYLGKLHPSLPNYIVMTSGSAHGIHDDGSPSKHRVDGPENLADQLDAAGIPWRAYMEDMGDSCVMKDTGRYAVRHDPFVYYSSLANDTRRCQDRVVDMKAHFSEDLAADAYQFMWITPNECNDMHDCSKKTSDKWLRRVIPPIMESPGYKKGGAIFLLWDEGSADLSYASWYVFKNRQNLPFVLISEHIVSPGFVSNTRYGHDSYLATMQDAFGLPRLPRTLHSTPMADFFGVVPATEDSPTAPQVDSGSQDGSDGEARNVDGQARDVDGHANDPDGAS